MLRTPRFLRASSRKRKYILIILDLSKQLCPLVAGFPNLRKFLRSSRSPRFVAKPCDALRRICQGGQEIGRRGMIRTKKPKVHKESLGYASVTEEYLVGLVEKNHFVERLH